MNESFGKYRVLERIGEGGFGQVYRGRDSQLARDVAIKTVSTGAPEFRERFPREAEIAAGLRHPAIVSIYDFGEEAGVPYLVQEYLTGEDMASKIARRDAGDLANRIGWLRQVADGLHYAHGRGVVHRDIKPSNVRILKDGTIRIMDFGIAKVMDATTQMTGTNVSLGTSGYVAPEQLEGRPIDHRADMFAFGVTAYELITYKRPFTGDTISATLYRILTEDPAPVDAVEPDCPPRLAACIERCLRKQREERFADMRVVGDELEAVLADLDTTVAWPRASTNASATAASLGTGGSAAPATPAPAADRSAITHASGVTEVSGATEASGVKAGTGRQKAVLVVAGLLLVAVTGWAVAALVGAARGGSGATSDPAALTDAGGTDDMAVATSVSDSLEGTGGDPVDGPTADTGDLVVVDPNAGAADVQSGPGRAGDTRTDSAGNTRTGERAGGTQTGGEVVTRRADSVTVAIPPAVQVDPARVLVLVTGERADAVRSAQNTVLAELLRAGRPVVDPDAIDGIRADAAAILALEAGSSPAAGVGREYGAGVVVVAELASDAAPAPGGFVSGTAILTARFYDTRTGAMLLAETYRVGSGGTPGRPGATETAAITQAAESVARQLARAILTKTGR